LEQRYYDATKVVTPLSLFRKRKEEKGGKEKPPSVKIFKLVKHDVTIL
jgi:hypothetical protein